MGAPSPGRAKRRGGRPTRREANLSGGQRQQAEDVRTNHA